MLLRVYQMHPKCAQTIISCHLHLTRVGGFIARTYFTSTNTQNLGRECRNKRQSNCNGNTVLCYPSSVIGLNILTKQCQLHTTGRRFGPQEQQNQQQIAKARPQTEISTARKVVETGRDITYLGIIIVGLCITGALFYFIGYELFSTQTSYGVFSTALKVCQQHPQVQDELGDPIKGHGERDSRGRSRHVNHILFEKDGIEFMRMQFYLKGSIRAGQAHLEVFKGESGRWETRYLFVETENYPRKVIVIEDNR